MTELEKILIGMRDKYNSLTEFFQGYSLFFGKTKSENLVLRADKLNLLSESIFKLEEIEEDYMYNVYFQIAVSLGGYKEIIEEYKKTNEYSKEIQDKTKVELTKLSEEESNFLEKFNEQLNQTKTLFDELSSEILKFHEDRITLIRSVKDYETQLSLIKDYEENKKNTEKESKSA